MPEIRSLRKWHQPHRHGSLMDSEAFGEPKRDRCQPDEIFFVDKECDPDQLERFQYLPRSIAGT